MKNNGARYETWSTGVLGPVVLHGLDKGPRDLSWQKWSYQVLVLISYSCFGILEVLTTTLNVFAQVGLRGEAMNLGSPNAISAADWVGGSLIARQQQPLTWYKVYIFASVYMEDRTEEFSIELLHI